MSGAQEGQSMEEPRTHSSPRNRAPTPLGEYTDGDAESPRPTREGPVRGTGSDGHRALSHARAIIALLFGPPAQRTFDVRYWTGVVEPALIASPFTLCVNRPGALRRMLLPPSELSIVEAYLSGDVDIEGDLEAAMWVGDAIGARLRSARRVAALLRHLLALPAREPAPDVHSARAARVVAPVGKRHELSRDKAAIQYHYDVGNDFYALWLDERMVYSCAYYHTPSDTLEEAQRAKLDLVCRKLRLRPGERFLDVGCGWGALIMHAAQHYGVTALGITLSEAQASLARQRITAAGVGGPCRGGGPGPRGAPPPQGVEQNARARKCGGV